MRSTPRGPAGRRWCSPTATNPVPVPARPSTVSPAAGGRPGAGCQVLPSGELQARTGRVPARCCHRWAISTGAVPGPPAAPGPAALPEPAAPGPVVRPGPAGSPVPWPIPGLAPGSCAGPRAGARQGRAGPGVATVSGEQDQWHRGRLAGLGADGDDGLARRCYPGQRRKQRGGPGRPAGQFRVRRHGGADTG